jgi:cell division protein FtsQ
LNATTSGTEYRLFRLDTLDTTANFWKDAMRRTDETATMPNTRARVKARRRLNKAGSASQPQGETAPPAQEEAPRSARERVQARRAREVARPTPEAPAEVAPPAREEAPRSARERIAARRAQGRRQARKQAPARDDGPVEAAPPRQAERAADEAPEVPPARHVRHRLHRERSRARQDTGAAGQVRQATNSLTAASSALSSARASATRQREHLQVRWKTARTRMQTPRAASRPTVHMGPKRRLLHWLASGRLLSLLLFIVSLCTLAFLFLSPQFQVQHIEVTGNEVLRSPAISQLSGVHNASVWFVDAQEVGQHLLENAYVEQASVRIRLPDRAIIEVVERRPEVRWQVGGIHYVLDGNGTVLDTTTEPPEPGTLVIVSTPPAPGQGGELQPLDHVDPDALELARALSLRLPVELGFTPAMIGWDIGLGVYVTSGQGQTIVFGRTDNLERKLAIFRHLLNEGTTFNYLDLRPSNPFYRTEG